MAAGFSEGQAIHAAGLAAKYPAPRPEPDEWIEWDHTTALVFREHDPETGLYDPPENDPRYLRPVSRQAHRRKTGQRAGSATTAGSDAAISAKINRLLARKVGSSKTGRRKWPKRAWPTGRKMR